MKVMSRWKGVCIMISSGEIVCIYMCVCICICMCMYVCICVYLNESHVTVEGCVYDDIIGCVDVYTYVCIHAYVYVCVCMCAYEYI